MNESQKQAEIARENEHLKAALHKSAERNRLLAQQVQDLLFKNERLIERAREAQQQMRLMRDSTSWRLGGALRGGRRVAGTLARNLRGLRK